MKHEGIYDQSPKNMEGTFRFFFTTGIPGDLGLFSGFLKELITYDSAVIYFSTARIDIVKCGVLKKVLDVPGYAWLIHPLGWQESQC